MDYREELHDFTVAHYYQLRKKKALSLNGLKAECLYVLCLLGAVKSFTAANRLNQPTCMVQLFGVYHFEGCNKEPTRKELPPPLRPLHTS